MRSARSVFSVLVVLLSSVVCESFVHAQRPAGTKKPMVELFVVVDIAGELSVMKRAEQIALSKQVVVDLKEGMKAYIAAKKEAAKNKETFDQPKPVLKKVKLVGRPYKTQELAEAQMEKVKKLHEKSKSKRRTSPTKPAANKS